MKPQSEKKQKVDLPASSASEDDEWTTVETKATTKTMKKGMLKISLDETEETKEAEEIPQMSSLLDGLNAMKEAVSTTKKTSKSFKVKKIKHTIGKAMTIETEDSKEEEKVSETEAVLAAIEAGAVKELKVEVQHPEQLIDTIDITDDAEEVIGDADEESNELLDELNGMENEEVK